MSFFNSDNATSNPNLQFKITLSLPLSKHVPHNLTVTNTYETDLSKQVAEKGNPLRIVFFFDIFSRVKLPTLETSLHGHVKVHIHNVLKKAGIMVKWVIYF